jgi:hypothetical protein
MVERYSDDEWDYVEIQITGTFFLPLVNSPMAVNPGTAALRIESLIHEGYEIIKLPESRLSDLADMRIENENWWIKLRKRKER